MTQTNLETQKPTNSETMENNQPIQNQHCVIPTERSDEGSLTSVAFGPYGRRTSFQNDKIKFWVTSILLPIIYYLCSGDTMLQNERASLTNVING